MAHTCQAFALTCMDFRFHTAIRKFLSEDLGLERNYDLVSLAGSAKDLVRTRAMYPSSPSSCRSSFPASSTRSSGSS